MNETKVEEREPAGPSREHLVGMRLCTVGVLAGLLGLALLPCGCTSIGKKAYELANPQHLVPSFIFPPGYRMLIHGQQASIFGSDPCPTRGVLDRIIYGPNQYEASGSCLVITPKTTSVHVRAAFASGSDTEVWTVKHGADGSIHLFESQSVKSDGLMTVYQAEGAPVIPVDAMNEKPN